MTSKPVVVEKAKVKTDQLLKNVNKLSEPSTISKEKIELIELPKDSILPTGFRFIDLFILSPMFSLLTCPNYSITNTLKLQLIEEKKKGLARFYANLI